MQRLPYNVDDAKSVRKMPALALNVQNVSHTSSPLAIIDLNASAGHSIRQAQISTPMRSRDSNGVPLHYSPATNSYTSRMQ